MTQERNHQIMEQGAEATVVMGFIRDIVDDMMRTKLSVIISQYRQGNIDHDMLIGRVAEIASLDDLMAELDNRQRRAEIAAKKEFDGGKI